MTIQRFVFPSNIAGLLILTVLTCISNTAFAIEIVPANCISPPAGLVAWWRGEDNANDSVGSASGTLYGGVSFSPGQVGTALAFNGINGAVNIPDAPALALTNSLTIEGWLFLTNSPTSQGMVIFRGDTRPGLDAYEVYVSPGPGGSAVVGFGMTDPANNVASLMSPMPIGSWVHIAVTLDDASNALKLYTNGIVAAQTTTSLRPLGPLDAAYHPGHRNWKPF